MHHGPGGFFAYIGQLVFGGIGKWLIAVIAGLIGYLLPTPAVQNAFIGTGVLIVVDMFTAIVAAAATKEHITSAKFGRTVMKLFAYSSATLSLSLLVKSVPELQKFQEAVVIGVLTLVMIRETYSILENVARMGYRFELVSQLLRERAGKKDGE